MSYVPPLPPPLPPTRPAGRPRRAPWIVAALAALVAVGGILFGTGVIRFHHAPATFTMTGVIEISGGGDQITLADDGTCSGTGGFSDMTPGTAVTVADGTGKIVATGSLGPGSQPANGIGLECDLPITVDAVPLGFMTAAQARTPLALSLSAN
jgi:hypothetical protein